MFPEFPSFRKFHFDANDPRIKPRFGMAIGRGDKIESHGGGEPWLRKEDP